MITIDDFKKLNLVVGEIIKATKIEGSDNLLLIEVDLGKEKRKIVSGIAREYNPGKLVGKQIVVLENLKPRTFFNQKSQGMLLAAETKKGAVLLIPEKPVKIGSKIT